MLPVGVGACLVPDGQQRQHDVSLNIKMPSTNNIACGCSAMQSSTSEWSCGATAAEDAAGAVSGTPNGRRNFHTAFENSPWWQVDLGEAKPVSEVRIYNTLEPEVSRRFEKFSIVIAIDADEWIEVFRKESDDLIGGVDGSPFIWKPCLTAFARFVRVTLIGQNFLHLDQVEIFGPTSGDAVRVLPPRKIPAPDQLDDAGLFSKFISLGDNCEFGIVQGQCGLSPLDLLRFGGTGDNETGLILAIQERFSAFGTVDDFVLSKTGDEWMVHSQRYRMTFHTHRNTSQFSQDQMTFEMMNRFRLLAAKLVEDLESGEKLLVRKSNKPVTVDTMLEMYSALSAYGQPKLLWVSENPERHGTVVKLKRGFLRGYIRRLAPYHLATDVRVDDWRDVCLAALIEGAGVPD